MKGLSTRWVLCSGFVLPPLQFYLYIATHHAIDFFLLNFPFFSFHIFGCCDNWRLHTWFWTTYVCGAPSYLLLQCLLSAAHYAVALGTPESRSVRILPGAFEAVLGIELLTFWVQDKFSLPEFPWASSMFLSLLHHTWERKMILTR